jgi:hypothetical protein
MGAPIHSAARFAEPAVIYHHCERATPSAFDAPPARTEPLVYHPVIIHCDPRHVHPMVTRRVAGILRHVDRLILSADRTATPPGASLVRSSARVALADPH